VTNLNTSRDSQPKEKQTSCLGKVANDWEFWVVAERNDEFVHHKSEDSELSGTSVVELDGTLGELLLLAEGVPAEVNVSVTEVTNELVAGSWNILHEGALKDSDESNDLNKSSGWDGIRAEKGSNTVRVGVERVTRVVNVSWKVDSGTGHDLAEESKLGDTAVLDLDVSEAVEAFLVLAGELSEGIEEAKRSLGTEFILEGHAGGNRGLGLGSRRKGSSGGKEGGKNDKLHGCCWLIISEVVNCEPYFSCQQGERFLLY